MIGFVGSHRVGRAGFERRRGLGVGLMAAVVSLAVAGCLGSSPTPEIKYVIDTPPPSSPGATASATPTPTLTPTLTPMPTPTPTPTPTPSPTPAPVACTVANLKLTITDSGGGIYWQGGGGHKLAAVVVKNMGAVPCTLKAMNQVLLLNGDDSILILGKGAPTSTTLTVAPGGTLRTQVQTGNFCDGPTIVAPVRAAFMVPGGTGLIVVTPPAPTDTGGVPPCLGDPGVYTGSVEMQPWAP
jgi:Protein of unknown function (DUF4232)